jgi:2-aminoethylphosphonate-pyruvate transaminase
MSSFGGVEIDVPDLGIDYLISSANKCIQGVPGFGFVIAKLEKLLACEGNARSLSLDLFDQWKEMDKEGKWRYTSPTHVVAAFSKAIDELIEEGGISARNQRYHRNNRILREGLEKLGFHAYISEENQSPIITSFLYPKENFEFEDFYKFVKSRGYVIYPGKLTDADTFRIGNIGEIYEEDINKLCNIIENYLGVTV